MNKFDFKLSSYIDPSVWQDSARLRELLKYFADVLNGQKMGSMAQSVWDEEAGIFWDWVRDEYDGYESTDATSGETIEVSPEQEKAETEAAIRDMPAEEKARILDVLIKCVANGSEGFWR